MRAYVLQITKPIKLWISTYFISQNSQLKAVRFYGVTNFCYLSIKINILFFNSFPNCQKIIHGYGMTETSFIIIKSYDTLDSEQKHGSCGHVIPGMKVKVSLSPHKIFSFPHTSVISTSFEV